MTAVNRSELATQLMAMAEAAGLTLEDLAVASGPAVDETPTVRAFLTSVEAATTEGARLTYRPYWMKLVEGLGDTPLSRVKTSDLQALALAAQEHALGAPTTATACRPGRTSSLPPGRSSPLPLATATSMRTLRRRCASPVASPLAGAASPTTNSWTSTG